MKSGVRFGICSSIASLAVLMILGGAGCASPQSSNSKPMSQKEQVQYLLGLAAANVTENDSISALQTLNKVRDLDDSVPECYFLYSLAYLSKGETRLALESARYAVKLDPKYTAAKNALGRILLDLGKFEESEKHLTEAVKDLLFRDSYLPKLNLGILFYKKMDLSKSEYWLSKSINEGSFPLTCLAYYYRGKVKLARNELQTAERDLNLSTKGGCSGMSEAHLAVGQTLVREKKYDLARAKFLEIQRLFPGGDAFDQATQYLRDIP
jgi:type IV pilus assembly protein PilF